MIYAKLSFIVLIIFPIVWTATDYCDLECGTNQHIACNNDGSFASTCSSNAQIIPITLALRNEIVNGHNIYRNGFAKGFDKFKPAARMATMVWSNELAEVAAYNVKQCQMKSDKCRLTSTYNLYVGQNLAITSWSGQAKSVSKVIHTHLNTWFAQYKNCPVDVIDKYYVPKNGQNIGVFTLMVQDKSTHVGCAILRQRKNGVTQQLMACNYSFTNVDNKTVYLTGPAGSKCETGVNINYTFLCSTNEIYNVMIIT